jgi:hypothetical protein
LSSDLSVAAWSLVRGSKGGITPVQSFYNNSLIKQGPVTDIFLHPMSGEVVILTAKYVALFLFLCLCLFLFLFLFPFPLPPPSSLHPEK